MDREWKIYVLAWRAFHEAANLVDGHLPPWEMTPESSNLAVAAGVHAMDTVLQHAGKIKPNWNDKKWQKAKRVALIELGY